MSNDLYSSPKISVIKSRRISGAWHVTQPVTPRETIAQVVKKLPLVWNRCFVVCITWCHQPAPSNPKSIDIKSVFNIIPPTTQSPKWSLCFKLHVQHCAFISQTLYNCYSTRFIPEELALVDRSVEKRNSFGLPDLRTSS
jgi:hypothetical protein